MKAAHIRRDLTRGPGWERHDTMPRLRRQSDGVPRGSDEVRHDAGPDQARHGTRRAGAGHHVTARRHQVPHHAAAGPDHVHPGATARPAGTGQDATARQHEARQGATVLDQVAHGVAPAPNRTVDGMPPGLEPVNEKLMPRPARKAAGVRRRYAGSLRGTSGRSGTAKALRRNT